MQLLLKKPRDLKIRIPPLLITVVNLINEGLIKYRLQSLSEVLNIPEDLLMHSPYLQCTIHKVKQYRYNTRCRLFKIWGFFVHNKPEAEAQRSSAQAASNYKTEREHARNSFGSLPQGYYERKNSKS